jgi:transposase-like protein
MNGHTCAQDTCGDVPANHQAGAAHAARELREAAVDGEATPTADPTVEGRLGAVLSVISGRSSCAQEASRGGVAEADVEHWRRLFIESGRRGLLGCGCLNSRPSATSLALQNTALKSELQVTLAELRSCRRTAGGQLGPFAQVEEIRQESEITISRFCVLIGVSRRTYFRRLILLRSERPPGNERDSTSIVSICAQLVEDYVAMHPDYGYRRIHELMIADGHAVSASTVLRAMRLSQCRASDVKAQGPLHKCPEHGGPALGNSLPRPACPLRSP